MNPTITLVTSDCATHKKVAENTIEVVNTGWTEARVELGTYRAHPEREETNRWPERGLNHLRKLLTRPRRIKVSKMVGVRKRVRRILD